MPQSYKWVRVPSTLDVFICIETDASDVDEASSQIVRALRALAERFERGALADEENFTLHESAAKPGRTVVTCNIVTPQTDEAGPEN